MGFLDLFIVALIPVIEVLLITGVGLFLALDSVKLLGPDARHSLNNLVFFVFCPALVISNLAETITSESLVSLWFMPVNILLTFIIGSALAWFLIQITKTPPHLHGLVIGCCSAGNLGNLLLIIIPAVCQEANSPFGDSFDCSTYGEAYASLSMAVGAIYIWSYVYIIMRVCANKSAAPVVDDSVANIEFFKESSERFLESCKQSLPPSMHCAGTDDNSGLVELPGGTSSVKRMQVKIIHYINIIAEKIYFKMIFAPSTIAAILGFMIGSVSQIRKALIGDSASLYVLDSSASLLGEVAIPCMTLIIGANLLTGLKRTGIGLPVIAGVVLVRYLFLPLLGIGVVKVACNLGMVGSDLLYQFVLMLQYALPPAMSVGTITQLFDAGQSECSVIMLWSYVVGAFFLTLWSTIYMWILA